jgi:hypothetical protein
MKLIQRWQIWDITREIKKNEAHTKFLKAARKHFIKEVKNEKKISKV